MIKKIKTKYLILIITLLPISSLLGNHVLRLKVFEPLSNYSMHLIQPTLVVNLIQLLVFSILIFFIGGLRISDVFVNQDKIKRGIKWVFLTWLVINIISITYGIISYEKLELTKNLNVTLGTFIGQFFGNSVFEELIYRGILLIQLFLILKSKFQEKLALFIAILSSQAIFALIHIPNLIIINPVDSIIIRLLHIFILGVLFSLIFVKTKNLILLIGFHALFNAPTILFKNDIETQLMITVLILAILLSFFLVSDSKEKLLNN